MGTSFKISARWHTLNAYLTTFARRSAAFVAATDESITNSHALRLLLEGSHSVWHTGHNLLRDIPVLDNFVAIEAEKMYLPASSLAWFVFVVY